MTNERVDMEDLGEVRGGAVRPAERPVVLVVEDDVPTSTMLQAALRQHGFKAEFAFNGEEALRKILTGTYSAILLDLMMPKMNGWEVLTALNENALIERLNIIVLSAHLLQAPEKVLALGAKAIYPKPFNIPELMQFLSTCCFKAA